MMSQQKSTDASGESPEQQAPVSAPEEVPQDNNTPALKIEDQQQEETVADANGNTDGANKQQSDKMVEEN